MVETFSLYNQLNQKCDLAMNCTVPFMKKCPGGRYRILGSAIYLEHENHRFLITAAHVLNGLSSKELLVFYEENAVYPIDSKGFYHNENGKIDIAVCEIDRSLPYFIPITMKDILNIQKAPDEHIFIACGYPETMAKNYRNNSEIGLTNVMSIEIKKEEYKKYNTTREYNIIIRFDRNNIFTGENSKATFAIPNGMSGGGLFWIHRNAIFDNAIKPKLVGILNEWDWKENIMIATNIITVNAVFSEGYKISTRMQN